MTVTFEGYERRADKINKCLADNGIASLEEALQICTDKGFNPREIVNNTQSIAFQNAEWAYTLGCALAVKRGAKSASEAAAIIGEGIQAFTVPGSVAEGPQGRSGPRQPGRYAALRRHRVLRLPGRSRVLRCRLRVLSAWL